MHEAGAGKRDELRLFLAPGGQSTGPFVRTVQRVDLLAARDHAAIHETRHDGRELARRDGNHCFVEEREPTFDVTLTQECTPLLLARESDEIGLFEPVANGGGAGSDIMGDVVLSRSEMVLGDGKNAGPDVAVIEGDVDRSAIRRAVNLRELGGRLIFALEAVSTSEKEIRDKDLEDNVERYAAEGVAEYLTVFPVAERRVRDLVGRRLSEQGEYEEILPDAAGRVFSEQLGLYFSIDPESEELVAVDAETGQRLLTSDEEEARGDREAAARQKAEERAEQEAESRRQAERHAERVEDRAEQALRGKVEDLCGLLGIEWSAERSAVVAGMSLAQLEALWADLLSRKRWP